MRIRLLRSFAIGALSVLLAAHAYAADPGFSLTLSGEEKVATGVSRLSAAQQGALDEQIARDINLARQGNVVGFAKTFSLRRTPEQASAIGLGQLTAQEIERLDQRVAYAIAHRPPVSFSYQKSEPQPAPDISVKVSRPPLQIHGQVSLEYGQCGGVSFYGGNFYVICYDPVCRLTIMIGASSYRGHLPFYERVERRLD